MQSWQIDFDVLEGGDFYRDWCYVRIIKKSKWVLSFKTNDPSYFVSKLWLKRK